LGGVAAGVDEVCELLFGAFGDDAEAEGGAESGDGA